MWMASFLTIPLYKLVCNLSYIDDLQGITFYSKELCVYGSLDVYDFFVTSIGTNDLCVNIRTNTSYVTNVVHLIDSCAHELGSVNIYVHACECTYKNEDMLHNYFLVKFFSRVSNFTLLEFISLQDSILVISGEPALVFFRIYNPTGVDITGMSMYFVYPSNMALYVSKVQCFCFDLLQIKKNESVELPVLFYIDSTIEIETVVFNSTIYLSYVFFLQ
jgi:cytochrome c oxidase assembly protein Cox11